MTPVLLLNCLSHTLKKKLVRFQFFHWQFTVLLLLQKHITAHTLSVFIYPFNDAFCVISFIALKQTN